MYTLAWYCIQLLLDTIQEISPTTPLDPKGKGKAKEPDTEAIKRVHRLELMLISTISSLPISLMLRALDEVRLLIMAYPTNAGGGADATEAGTKSRRTELLDALFSELLEKTGDREKEVAMRWWYKYRSTLVPGAKEGRGGLPSWFKGRNVLEKEGQRDEEQHGKAAAGEETGNQTGAVVLSRL